MAADNIFGFSPEDWANKSETERQLIRNAILNEFPNEDAQAQASLVDDPTSFDLKFGGKYTVPWYKRSFGNTSSVINQNRFGNKVASQLEERARKYEKNNREFYKRYGEAGSPLNGANSYSGCDITPTITVGSKSFVIGNISTISYSIHRDKTPVRVLGHTYPKGFVSAGRTIAGTLIFTIFDRHALHDIIASTIAEADPAKKYSSPLVDQLPPFDITILYQNEFGSTSYMSIYGVEISDEGQSHSINDIYTENVMQYVARDIDLMMWADDSWTPRTLAFTNNAVFIDDQHNKIVKSQIDELNKIRGNRLKDISQLALIVKDLTSSKTSIEDITPQTAATIAEIATLTRLITESNEEIAAIQSQVVDIDAQLLDAQESDQTQLTQSQINRVFTSKKDSPYNLDRTKLTL